MAIDLPTFYNAQRNISNDCIIFLLTQCVF